MKERWNKCSLAMKISYIATLALHLLPALVLSAKLIFFAESIPTKADEANILLMVMQCLLVIIVMHVPLVVEAILKTELSDILCLSYWMFLTGSVFLGEVCKFFYRIKHWDDILHFFSAILTALLSFMLFSRFTHGNSQCSVAFMLLFAVSFSVLIGVLWEIYEYAFDGLIGLNMQKFALEDGVLLVGRAALDDTMKDVIVDTSGALTTAAYGYISIRRRTGFIWKCLNPSFRQQPDKPVTPEQNSLSEI